jgi:hypothetical protein
MKKQINPILISIIVILCCILFIVWPRQQPPIVTVTDSLSPRLEPTLSDFNVKIVQDSLDTVRNPYAPPLKYNENTYSQVGYLSRGSAKYILFGKPAHSRRDKWYYYTTIHDIKLPIEVNNRKCSVPPGCDSLSTKDKVKVDGEEYTVTMYETELLYYV